MYGYVFAQIYSQVDPALTDIELHYLCRSRSTYLILLDLFFLWFAWILIVIKSPTTFYPQMAALDHVSKILSGLWREADPSRCVMVFDIQHNVQPNSIH
jgi:hypothetical protein